MTHFTASFSVSEVCQLWGILGAASRAGGRGLGDSDGRETAWGLPRGAGREGEHQAGLSGKTSLRFLCELPPGNSKISEQLGSWCQEGVREQKGLAGDGTDLELHRGGITRSCTCDKTA